MKLWEKILEGRLNEVIEIGDNQFGFSAGKSTTDTIIILRHIRQKNTENREKLYRIFIDLEKVFDRVPRSAIEWALRRQLVPDKLVTLVMVLYVDAQSSVLAARVRLRRLR